MYVCLLNDAVLFISYDIYVRKTASASIESERALRFGTSSEWRIFSPHWYSNIYMHMYCTFRACTEASK